MTCAARPGRPRGQLAAAPQGDRAGSCWSGTAADGQQVEQAAKLAGLVELAAGLG